MDVADTMPLDRATNTEDLALTLSPTADPTGHLVPIGPDIDPVNLDPAISPSTVKHWFYLAWFHSRRSPVRLSGHFLDQHPYTRWQDFHYRVWYTRDGSSSWGPNPAFLFGKLVITPFTNAQRTRADSHPGGVKRQAVENLENERSELFIQTFPGILRFAISLQTYNIN